MTAITNTIAADEAQGVETIDVVRSAMRLAITASLWFGAFSVLSLFVWGWLAALCALFTTAVGERVLTITGCDDHVEAAAQFTAKHIVSGVSWLRTTFGAKKEA